MVHGLGPSARMGRAFKDTPSFDGLGPGLQGILGRLGVLDSDLKLELMANAGR
jgi:hypothetical protein